MAADVASPLIGIHLDLKGVAFRPKYIPELLRDLASQGVNAVLVEYEDLFPFEGIEIAYDSASVWSRKTLRQFQREAAHHGIEIIPLQQCLGHLEYVFRWKTYVKYAVNPRYPSTVNLSKAEARALVKEMLRQVIEAHPDSRYVHLGMDEAHGLTQTAEQTGRPVLELFIEFLHELLAIAEQYGKTPIIWSDMLEDHFLPGIFDDIKDRVILAPWDYASKGTRGTMGRIVGWRISNEWLNEPENPEAPAIGMKTNYFEDLPANTQTQIKDYRHGREIDSFFQVDMWTQLGFRVLGATAIRVSAQGCVLPSYSQLNANICGWAEAIKRNNQMGLIGTSWARGNTFCPPNYSIDLTWPCITEMARSLGAAPAPFFAGIPADTLHLLLAKLSRCRKDWSIEQALMEEMRELAPQLTMHQYEWQSLQLMTRVLSLHRQVDHAISEVEFFRAAGRPVTPEWQRRIDDQRRLRHELNSLRTEVKRHFGQRCTGAHFTEWLDHLFTVPMDRLTACEQISRKYQREAKQRYGW